MENTFQHVMVDLETYGLRPGCTIRSIGAVAFSFMHENTRKFEINVSREDSKTLGFKEEPSTIMWWETQPEAVRNQFNLTAYPVNVAIARFIQFFKESNAPFIWSHGANFDLPILDFAFDLFKQPAPWHYANTRDTRTIYWMGDIDSRTEEFDGVRHTALADAEHQVKCLRKAMKNIWSNKVNR